MADIYNTGSDSGSSKTPPPEEQKTKTEEVFENFLKGLEDKIKNSKNDLDVKTTEFNSALATRRYATNKLDQGQKAVKEYTQFSNNVSNSVGQDVLEVDTKIGEAIKGSASVKTKMDAAIDAIKAAKDKMALVDSKACKLSDALKESCNADQLRILCGIPDFNDLAEEIINKSDEAHDTADDASEAAVKVSAALAFANVESLKDYGTSLKDKGAAFQSDVSGNLDFNNEKLDEAQEEVTASLIVLSTAECAKYESYLGCDGLVKLQAETFDKDMATIGSELFTICHSLEDTFDYADEGRLEDEVEEKRAREEDDNWSQPTDGPS